MRALFILFLFACGTLVSAQSTDSRGTIEDNIDLEQLPEIVLSKIGDDFSIYLPDKNPDISVQQMQKYFVAYDLGKDFEGYDSFLVMMKNEKGTLTATYNTKGKLIRVVEKYENVKLPNEVIYAVLKEFPGWGITDDKYHYTQADGDIKKRIYTVKIQKERKTKKVIVTPSGQIIN